MLFSSAIFLFLFLPLVLLLYYLTPRRGKNILILLASLFFYTWGEMEIVFVMLTSTVVDYFCGLAIQNGKRKSGLFISILVNLGLLAFFKYGNFTLDNFNALVQLLGITNENIINLPRIALPLGISFYTFQTMSYTIDVYRGVVRANRNFIDFATYVTLFPQLIAGPIVRYRDIHDQLKHRKESVNKFSEGIERFIIGLSKKMILANTLGAVSNDAFTIPGDQLSFGMAWLGIICYTLHVYFDFSGYSDMAIGLGKMLGFDIMENFNYPYIARSVRDFWRRWHISLSTWLRDYLYIPLGGSRVGPVRVYINLFTVFVLCGLWHGASWNFVLFGVLHGIFLVAERLGLEKWLEKSWRPISHIYLLWFFSMSLVLFGIEHLSDAMNYYHVLYGGNGVDLQGVYKYFNLEMLLVGLAAIVLSMPIYHIGKRWAVQYTPPGAIMTWTRRFTFQVLLLFLLVLSASYLAADVYNPFLYFRF